jgi:HTH-type transcriptional regulator/antitoxin HipB
MEIIVQNPKLLGTALRRFRRIKKLNQSQVGKEFCIDQTTISSIENGAPGTRIETIFRLLAAMGLEIIIRDKVQMSEAVGWEDAS